MTPEAFKWCSFCKREHPAQFFGSDASRVDGLAATCKDGRRDRRLRNLKPEAAPMAPRDDVMRALTACFTRPR